MSFDVILKKGKVVDGTGNPWFRADIAISQGKIAKVGKSDSFEADDIINVEGAIVAPGFIDIHSHSDQTALMHKFCTASLRQGITTELVGNCGMFPAPVSEKNREYIKEAWLEAEVEVDWTTIRQYLDRLERKGIAINIAALIGHAALRSYVMGVEGEGGERRVPTEDQMKEMKKIVDASMKDGAFGLSAGLVFPISRNARTKEIMELCKVVAKYNGVYQPHPRSEGGEMPLIALRETIQIAEKTGVRANVTHIKGRGGPHAKDGPGAVEFLRLIDAARARGVDIVLDVYPFNHWEVRNLGSIIPGYVEDREKTLTMLKDIEYRKKLEKEAEEKHREGILRTLISREGITTALLGHMPTEKELKEGDVYKIGHLIPSLFVGNEEIVFSKTHLDYMGKTVEEVAKLRGKDLFATIIDLVLDDKGWIWTAGAINEDDLRVFIKHPAAMVSTDHKTLDEFPSLSISGVHPRTYGTYPRVLGEYVREERVLTLEEAVRKMTSLPAQTMGLRDRGLIKEGFWADITVFNPDTVKCVSTYVDPLRYPDGVEYVIVNGKLAVRKGEHTGVLAGRALRHRKWP